MKKIIQWSLLLAWVALWAGCTTPTITNLTVSRLPRASSGMYPVEVDWDCPQQSVRPATVQPYVIIGFESYKMRPVMGMNNRWETVVPVPADKNAISYFVRFDFEYNKLGKTYKSSQLSHGYTLEIMEK
jgi:hypothetical protein